MQRLWRVSCTLGAMIRFAAALLAFAGCATAQVPDPLPPAVRDLLERARQANPQRYQFALDRGATLSATSDGRSFSLAWFPESAPRESTPVIVTLHGSSSWAFDEF